MFRVGENVLTTTHVKWRILFGFYPAVGSFVWTHLQNLKKTSVTCYLELQTMLSGDINKKFNTDVRKFSRNYEYSFFLSEYGVGETLWNISFFRLGKQNDNKKYEIFFKVDPWIVMWYFRQSLIYHDRSHQTSHWACLENT